MGKRKISRLFLCLLLFLPLLLFSKCDFLEPEEEETAVSVTINLSTPNGIDVSGKSWEIIFETDIENIGSGEFDYYTSGTCGSGSTQIIQLNNVEAGAYYLFAVIYMSQRTEAGPQYGDYIGVYGDIDPEELTTPNAVVPESGSATFNINMWIMGGSGNGDPVLRGNLYLPAPAPGKEYSIYLDNDYNYENGTVADEYGVCGSSTTVPYQIESSPPGTYRLYAVVHVVGTPGSSPEIGDYFGVIDEAVIPETGTANNDITLSVYDGN